MGEALERYALGTIPGAALLQSTAAELPGPYLDPSTVVRYTYDQRVRQGLTTFSANDEAWWIAATGMDDVMRSVWVPAALVFAPFPELPLWVHPGIQNSNGAAYHQQLPQAVHNAWLELVERDAFLRAWRLGVPIQQVPDSSLPRQASVIAQTLKSEDPQNRVAVGLLPSRHAPVWLCLAAGPNIGICIGTAAGHFEDAVLKATCECLCQTMFPVAPLESAASVRRPHDHAAFFRFGTRFRRAERLFSAFVSPGNLKVPRYEQPSAPALYVELEVPTPFGGHAVKVLDPRLVPLTFGHDAEPLDRTPLAGVSLFDVSAGDRADPHPFP